MKLTLLQVVQSVLSAMEADSVNSISDTFESAAVTRVAEEVYYELINKSDWPRLEQMARLQGMSDNSSPTTLRVPENVKYVKAFWYDNKELIYKSPEDFIRYLNEQSIDPANQVLTALPNGIEFPVRNNTAPTYFTMFENSYIVTDSFDKVDGSTLHASRSYLTGNIIPTFYTDDAFVPDLEPGMFTTYLAMVKRASFLYLRREASPHDERVAIAGLGRLMQDKQKLYRLENKISYGR